MLTPSILYFIIIYLILLRAKTLTSSGGVIERVQILLLVAFLFLVNIAQRADVPVVEASISSKSSGPLND